MFEAIKNLKIIKSTLDEKKCIDSLANDSYLKKSEMSKQDRYFLNSMLLRNKPNKILELGVSAGGSSVIILNTLKSFKESLQTIIIFYFVN